MKPEHKDEIIWVDAELYLSGTTEELKDTQKIVFHTKDYGFGRLVLPINKRQLELLRRKRLQGRNTVHVRIKQDFHTGQYDPTTASLLNVQEPPLPVELDDAYIERLIKRADPAWKDVDDPEAWLREIRGYDD